MPNGDKQQQPLWDVIKSNISTLILIATMIGSLYVNVFRIDRLEKTYAAQEVEVDTLEKQFGNISISLVKIQTSIDEGVKPQLNEIKQDVKTLQGKK